MPAPTAPVLLGKELYGSCRVERAVRDSELRTHSLVSAGSQGRRQRASPDHGAVGLRVRGYVALWALRTSGGERVARSVGAGGTERKSTRLNSSHVAIS